MSYQESADLTNLARLRVLAPADFDAFLHFHQAAYRDGGAVPLKYRELVAVAVGMAGKCGYCIETHSKGALAAGATRAEIAEVAFVAAAVCAGGTAAHGLLALRLLDEPERREDR
jgi:AhpD family alkylhydroperoxidase